MCGAAGIALRPVRKPHGWGPPLPGPQPAMLMPAVKGSSPRTRSPASPAASAHADEADQVKQQAASEAAQPAAAGVASPTGSAAGSGRVAPSKRSSFISAAMGGWRRRSQTGSAARTSDTPLAAASAKVAAAEHQRENLSWLQVIFLMALHTMRPPDARLHTVRLLAQRLRLHPLGVIYEMRRPRRLRPVLSARSLLDSMLYSMLYFMLPYPELSPAAQMAAPSDISVTTSVEASSLSGLSASLHRPPSLLLPTAVAAASGADWASLTTAPQNCLDVC